MNYNWDDIPLENFIKASEGDFCFVAKNGRINSETKTSWFSIQDKYIEVMELESIEVKKYKTACYNYAIALKEWILNPKRNSKDFVKVNRLYIQKEKLSKAIFSQEKTDWDKLIAKCTLNAKQRINAKEWLAKEFFNLIKVM